MSITATDIVTQFGAYYKNGGQGIKDLRLQFFRPSDGDAVFDVIRTNDTQLQGGNVRISPVLQMFQKQFTPMGDLTITGKKIPLYGVKIDVAEIPHVLMQTWAGFLTGDSINPKDWPFVRWWLEGNVLPQSKEDWDGAVFNGAGTAIVAGTAMPIDQGFKGLKLQINTAIDAGSCVPFVLGAPPDDAEDFCTYVETFAKMIDKRYRKFLQMIAMSETRLDLYKEGRRLKYNQQYAQVDDLLKVGDTGLVVQGFSSHEGSDKIWTTVKGNAVKGIRRPQNADLFDIQAVDRQVKALSDWETGVGFWRDDLIFTNDVDLD